MNQGTRTMRTHNTDARSDKTSYLLKTCGLVFIAACLPGLWSCASGSGDSGAHSTSRPAAMLRVTAEDTAKADCCKAPKEQETTELAISSVKVPDVELTDQNGKKVRVYTDLIQGRVVAMNFIFTTCTTICPPLTANFAKFQSLMGDHVGRDVQMISVSVDPTNDTPERLKAWGEKFGAGPGWTFLTGSKGDVDKLLKALRVFTPLKEDHSPLVLVGDDAKGEWKRVYGLAAPEKLVDVVSRMLPSESKAAREDAAAKEGEAARETAAAKESATRENAAARAYFSDVELVDQDGKTLRFYSDLIRGKVVVISCFFTSCTGICPVLNQKLQSIQDALGNRLGKDVHLISLSVDPLTDTPARLKEYAERAQAGPGWYFLSGDKKNVELALAKLGFSVTFREQHSNLFLVGNDKTGLWKKALGLADDQQLISIVQSVLNDASA